MAAGLYGKIPSFGDFLQRGLSSEFVEPWNEWISQGLNTARNSLGEAFMDHFLSSPPWRFALEPGIVNERGWCGVLLSSVDRVSRAYPLTLVVEWPGEPRLPALSDALTPLLDRMEAAALELIDGSRMPAHVIGDVEALARAVAVGVDVSIHTYGGLERLTLGRGMLPVAGLASQCLLEACLAQEPTYPLSAWWHGRWAGREAAQLVAAGLPDPETFAALLDGAWQERGWTALGEEKH